MPKPPYTPESLSAFCLSDEPPPEWQPPPWPKDCPEPGIYRGVSYEQYKAWPAVNATALKAGVELSPLHMRQAIDGHHEDSTARKFGRAVHCRFLEPQSFAERFLVAKPCSAVLKSGDREGQPCGAQSKYLGPDERWYCGTKGHAPEEVVTPIEFVQQEEADRIERMWAAVVKHPIVALLRAYGGCEVSLVWDRDGIPCKARLDKLIEDGPDDRAWIPDLKKCRAFYIDERSINRAIVDYRYDLQAAWYSDGVTRLTGKRVAFAWIFIEDGLPYDVRPKRATRGWLAGGRQSADWAFEQYKRALQTGEWLGVSPGWDENSPPDWFLKKHGVRA